MCFTNASFSLAHWVNRWMDDRCDEQVVGQMDGWLSRRMDGQIIEWVGGWGMDGEMDDKISKVQIRVLCTLQGLWKAQSEIWAHTSVSPDLPFVLPPHHLHFQIY